MALKLELYDQFGNVYPDGYRRLIFVSIDIHQKIIRAIFNNYKDQATRQDPTKQPFSETEYRIGPHPIPARLDQDGNIVESAIPGFDDFANLDNTNSQGVGTLVYEYIKTRPENSEAVDV